MRKSPVGPRNDLAASSTHEVEYTPDEEELIRAVDRFRCERHVRYPSLCDVLRIVRQLGYRKAVAQEGGTGP